MALTFTTVVTFNIKDTAGVRLKLVEITGDGSYSAGGYTLLFSDLGFPNGLKSVLPSGVMGSDGSGGTGLAMKWDRANGKLKLWKGAGSAAFTESAAGDPNGLKGIVLAVGY